MLHWNSIPTTSRLRFNALLHEEEFTDAQIRRDQIGFVCHFLREEENEARVSLCVIANFCGVSNRSLDWQWARYRVNSRANDPPRTPPDAASSYIIEIVRERFTEQKPVTYRLLQDALNGAFRFQSQQRLDELEICLSYAWTIVKCRHLDPLASDKCGWTELNKRPRSSD
jgi:hypothetical protein